jgi:hypothetical protein
MWGADRLAAVLSLLVMSTSVTLLFQASYFSSVAQRELFERETRVISLLSCNGCEFTKNKTIRLTLAI